MTSAVFRLDVAGTVRLAVGPAGDRQQWHLLEPEADLRTALVGGDLTTLWSFVADPVPDSARLLAPIDLQNVWAAGVTYRSSRQARVEESSVPDVYERLWEAERPELFFKATGPTVVGPDDPIGVRHDSVWNVPEPELALVLDPDGEIVAYTIGNDVSSRSIEGENPLYLPQAKIYDRSCALGPGLVPASAITPPFDIALEISRGADTVVQMSTSTLEMARSFRELARYAFTSQSHPDGLVLMTGTCLVPPIEHSLQAGDVVTISIPGLGVLRNPVVEV